MSDAVVLLGTVMKGPFQAGALAVLTEPEVKLGAGIDVKRVVASSSGALNGVFLSAALQAGVEAGAGERLSQLWIDHGNVRGAIHVNVWDLIRLRGLSDQKSILRLLRCHIRPAPTRGQVVLRLLLTDVDGETVEVGGDVRTRFDHVADLTEDDFATEEGLERVFQNVVASLSMPILFSPVSVQAGPRKIRAFDGGMLHRTPLSLALAAGISRIFVITPFPRVRSEPARLHGRMLASHIFSMTAHGRLLREEGHLDMLNRALEQLPGILPDEEQRERVFRVLGASPWAKTGPIQIVNITPLTELPGSPFSGLWSRDLRRTYVDAGKEAARRVLREMAAKEARKRNSQPAAVIGAVA